MALRDSDPELKRLATVTARNKALGMRLDVKLSTVQRILSGLQGTSIDYVEWIAAALNVSPAALLTPYAFTKRGAAPSDQAEPREALQSGRNTRPSRKLVGGS